MRVLQSLSIADAIEADASRKETYELRTRDGEVLFQFKTGHDAISGWYSGYSMFQPYLESLLEQEAVGHPNVRVARGWLVEGIEQGDDHAVLQLRDGTATDGDGLPSGAVEELRARYVVGCDGANSVIRKCEGLSMSDLGFEADWLVVFAKPDDPEQVMDMPDTAQVLDPARPTSVFRTSGKRFCRWEFKLMPGEDPEVMSEPDVAWDLISKWGITPENSRLVRNTVFRFRSLVADRWQSGRAFIAGDAAHLMPPFLGQGLCSGIRDAMNLAWKLDLVLRGLCDPLMMASYDHERRPHSAAIVKNSLRMGELVSVTDPDEAARRDDALRSGWLRPPPAEMPILTDGILLRDKDGAIASPAGQLAMQPRLRIGHEVGLLDDLIGNGWVVLATGFDPEASLGPRERWVMRRLQARFLRVEGADRDEVALDESGGFLEWLDAQGVDSVIVRPDFYVFAGVCRPEALNRAIIDLGSQLRLLPDPRSRPLPSEEDGSLQRG